MLPRPGRRRDCACWWSRTTPTCSSRRSPWCRSSGIGPPGLKSAELALHRFLERSAFDVPIADIGLPVFWGGSRRKAAEPKSKLPVIFATGQRPPDHPPVHSISGCASLTDRSAGRSARAGSASHERPCVSLRLRRGRLVGLRRAGRGPASRMPPRQTARGPDPGRSKISAVRSARVRLRVAVRTALLRLRVSIPGGRRFGGIPPPLVGAAVPLGFPVGCDIYRASGNGEHCKSPAETGASAKNRVG